MSTTRLTHPHAIDDTSDIGRVTVILAILADTCLDSFPAMRTR